MLDGHRVLLNAVDVWIFSHGSYHQARTVGFPNVQADRIQQRRYEEGEAAYIMELCSSQGSKTETSSTVLSSQSAVAVITGQLRFQKYLQDSHGLMTFLDSTVLTEPLFSKIQQGIQYVYSVQFQVSVTAQLYLAA